MRNSVFLADILIVLIFSGAVILLIAARVEYLMACHYMTDPYIVQGEVKELCKATLPARRESRYSGFDYVIVEYEYEMVTRTAKLMRTKQDYESRMIELAVDREHPNVAVRREYETPNDVGIRYFILLGFFLAMYIYGDFLRNMIEAFIVGAVIYYFRKPLIAHIYDNRKEEWQGTSSIVKADGSLPTSIVIMAFVMVFLICLCLTLSY